MQLIFVRNVNFSAAECNSFNMRKKNVGDLASNKISGGSHAKTQLLGCEVVSFGVQSNIHHNTKLQKSGCNSKYPYPLESSTLKLHKYTLKLYNYAVIDSFYYPQMLIYRL